MNAKVILMVALAASAAGAFAKDEEAKSAKKRPPVPYRETQAYQRRMGGDLIQPNTMQGKFIVFDAVGLTNSVDAVVRGIKAIYHLDASATDLKKTPAAGELTRVLKDNKANAAIFLVDDNGMPSFLLAPEDGWALVNVAGLKTKETKLYAERVDKELWRAFAFVCGAGITSTPGCVMNPVHSVWDVDALMSNMISPSAGQGMDFAMKKMGLRPFRRVTYRQACKEGWAPAPTNDFQKAIYESVKEGKDAPTKGMKIKFDPKAGK